MATATGAAVVGDAGKDVGPGGPGDIELGGRGGATAASSAVVVGDRSSRDDGALVESFAQKAAILALCFLGLQASYITWGLYQERIMTREYDFGSWKSSAFVVCCNRALALVVAATIMNWPGRERTPAAQRPPFFYFAPSSISNILSSWAQYEALKYVTFPMQVLSKSCKIIPVMLMGKVLQKRTYPTVEYIEAVVITIGVTMFSLSEKSGSGSDNTSFFGLLLLAMYLGCDSFTSQWQDRVFRDFKTDQYEMMFGINAFSIAFVGLELIFSGDGFDAAVKIAQDSTVVYDLLVMSVCSAVGQLFIFYTIKKFGPIVFTIVMTTRQMLSMVISTIVYQHPIGIAAIIGSSIVFATLFYRSRRKYLASKARG